MVNLSFDPPDVALVADWITIWQSERAAVAVDQEVRETSQCMAALWCAQTQAALAWLAADAADRCARPASPPWTPAPADAPDARPDGGAAQFVPGPALDPNRS